MSNAIDRVKDNYTVPSGQTKPKTGLWTRIIRIIWDNDEKTVEERRFVRKLDCALLTIAMLGYFVKYLSQANIANAYVSGMREDLGFQGDQYNTLLTMFTTGYVIGTFPGTMLMVWLRPSIWLPSCEVIWTILVMLGTLARKPEHLFPIRFFVGLLEATAYPGMVYVLSSWYGPSELAKRVVMFQATSSVGSMFSGYLQVAVYKGLNGIHGLAGWQWLFIIDGVICLPIAMAGFIFIPDSPANLNPRLSWYFSDQEKDIANARTERWKRAPRKGITIKALKETFSTWIPWTFGIPYVCFVVGLGSYQYMNIWVKSAAPWNRTTESAVEAANTIPTIGMAISIIMSLVYCWTSDATGYRWQVMAVGGICPLIGNIILAIWPPGNGPKLAGFFLNFTATPIGALMLAWVNELLTESAEARAITTGFLNTAAYAINAWAPNLIFPTSAAPQYKGKGYTVTAVFFAVWIVFVVLIRYLLVARPVTKFKRQYEEEMLRMGESQGEMEEVDKGDNEGAGGSESEKTYQTRLGPERRI